MALTVGTDSYVTVDAAQDYAEAHRLAFDGDIAQLEASLRRATQWVDATYRARFPGKRSAGRAQALEWPRKDAQDASGEDVGTEEIPVEIANATAEAAVREFANPGSLSPDVTPGQSKVLTEVEGIRWKVTGTSGPQSQKPILHVVEGILAPLIGGKTNRLLRA